MKDVALSETEIEIEIDKRTNQTILPTNRSIVRFRGHSILMDAVFAHVYI